MRTRRSVKDDLPAGPEVPANDDLSPLEDDAAFEPTAADPVDPDEARRRRIAERAYRRAEQRGFAPGQELDDWLAAEREDGDETRPGG